MEKTFNECVGCKDVGSPCRGSTCPNRNVKRHFCDVCGEELTDIYDYDGQELCEEHLLEACRREL
jgi:hypothetical protein